MVELKLGATSLDVCKVIVSHHPIKEIKVISHKVGLNWSQKYPGPNGKKDHFLEAYSHMTPPINEYLFSEEEFLSSDLREISQELAEDEVLFVVSKVKTSDGSYSHIPMMNFHPESNFGLSEIRTSLCRAHPGRSGALLNSGRFYHYYGDFLLNQRGWEAFLGYFLIPFNLVHPGYVGYRLVDGYSTLRLTADKKYKTKIPEVIEIL